MMIEITDKHGCRFLLRTEDIITVQEGKVKGETHEDEFFIDIYSNVNNQYATCTTIELSFEGMQYYYELIFKNCRRSRGAKPTLCPSCFYVKFLAQWKIGSNL